MGQLKQDKYGLSQSQAKVLGVANSSIKLDITLSTLDSISRAAVEGKVVDVNNNNIVGAVVRLTDANYNPIKSTVTNWGGYFLFNNIKNASSYRIMALANKKKLYESVSITIAEGQVINKTIVLQDDLDITKGVVVGEVYRSGTTTPIQGGVIYIYKIVNGVEVPYEVVFTNEYGNYMIKELEVGEYILGLSALGYTDIMHSVSITQEGQIIAKTLDMEVNLKTALGTISGVVVDEKNLPLAKADAILYRVNSDGSLTAAAYTKASLTGVYLFSDVPQGKYKVRSNYYEIIEA